MVKNLLARQETWVQSLSWEDPLEKEVATHCSFLALEVLTAHGVAKDSDMTWRLTATVFQG